MRCLQFLCIAKHNFIAEYFKRKTVAYWGLIGLDWGWIGLGTPLLFFGSECVCTETTSEQPTGHSGIILKAIEEGFKVISLIDVRGI